MVFASCTQSGAIKFAVTYGAAHGDKCFSVAVDAKDGTVLAAFVDEHQYFAASADIIGVPNSDRDFGKNYAEGKILYSTRQNAAYYSKLMAEQAGSTISLDKNYAAIGVFAQSKAADALKNVDAVSGSTLVDTGDYLKAIAYAAEHSK